MQFKDGVHVFTADGKDIGEVNRIVLDPRSKEVTHLVVRQGLLFTEDKVVPVRLVDKANEDQVVLSVHSDTMPDFAQFEETYYVPLDDETAPYPAGYVRPYLGYPPLGTAWWGYPGYAGYPAYPAAMPSSAEEVEQNIPEGTVGLKEGADVMTADGENVGQISRVIVDNASNRATHFVVAKGWLFKEKKLIPTSWVTKLDAREVQLSIGRSQFERLRSFDE